MMLIHNNDAKPGFQITAKLAQRFPAFTVIRETPTMWVIESEVVNPDTGRNYQIEVSKKTMRVRCTFNARRGGTFRVLDFQAA